MTRIILDPKTSRRLRDSDGPAELCDESGDLLGVFKPAELPTRSQPPLLSRDELDRRSQEGGRPLSEILHDLRALP